MKLVRYGAPGAEKPGLIDADGALRDLSAQVDDIAGAVLSPAGLARLQALPLGSLPLVRGEPRLGPCVGRVGKLICVGLNYRDHAEESGMAIPTEPVLFLKATSAISGPFDAIEIPPGAEKVDWEVELGVVIGQGGRYLSRERALQHVAGYCVINDVSERAYQLERGGQWDKGKSCDSFAPLGPWLVTRDDVPDAQNLALWLDVDGQTCQRGHTRHMIFDVPTVVAYVSQFMSLQPGDVIATGTPPGVGFGQRPPRYLRAGQTLRLGISGLGEQIQNTVSANLDFQA